MELPLDVTCTKFTEHWGGTGDGGGHYSCVFLDRSSRAFTNIPFDNTAARRRAHCLNLIAGLTSRTSPFGARPPLLLDPERRALSAAHSRVGTSPRRRQSSPSGREEFLSTQSDYGGRGRCSVRRPSAWYWRPRGVLLRPVRAARRLDPQSCHWCSAMSEVSARPPDLRPTSAASIQRRTQLDELSTPAALASASTGAWARVLLLSRSRRTFELQTRDVRPQLVWPYSRRSRTSSLTGA